MNGPGICLYRFILHGFLSQHTRFETKPHKEDLDIVFCVYVKGHLTRKQTHMWHLPRNSIAASEAYYLSTFQST